MNSSCLVGGGFNLERYRAGVLAGLGMNRTRANKLVRGMGTGRFCSLVRRLKVERE